MTYAKLSNVFTQNVAFIPVFACKIHIFAIFFSFYLLISKIIRNFAPQNVCKRIWAPLPQGINVKMCDGTHIE